MFDSVINKIKGVGLDCSTLSYRPDPEYLPSIIYLDSTQNNAFYLEGLLEDKQVIVRAGSIGGIRGVFQDIGKDQIDVLLLPAEYLAKESTMNELKEVLDREEIRALGIERPGNMEELEKAAENLKKIILPSYLALTLNPLHYQKEMLEWAEEAGVEIIGLDIYGSWEGSAATIQAFTLPFLLSYAASHSDLVLLPARDIVGAEYERLYLEELIGKERVTETEMKSTVIHNFPTLPTMIYTSLKSDLGIIPYNNPLYLTDPEEVVFGMRQREADYENPEEKEIMASITTFSTLIIPPPPRSEWPDYVSIVRPKIVEELKKKSAEVKQAKIGDTVFLLSVTTYQREKRWIGSDKLIPERKDYVLFMTEEGLKFECY
jgi:hypothetical protein